MPTKPKNMSDEEWKAKERERYRIRRQNPEYLAKKRDYDRNNPKRKAAERARAAKRRQDPAYREKNRAYCAATRHRYEYVRPPGLQEWQERSWGRISLHTMPHYAIGSLAAKWLLRFNDMVGVPDSYHHINDRMHQE